VAGLGDGSGWYKRNTGEILRDQVRNDRGELLGQQWTGKIEQLLGDGLQMGMNAAAMVTL